MRASAMLSPASFLPPVPSRGPVVTVRSAYKAVASPGDALRSAARFSVRSVIIDIEPLVSYWDTGQQALDRGLSRVVADLPGAVPGLRAVCFATNSARRPTVVPAAEGIEVSYVASARKPVRIGWYEDLPRPGAVIGDQVATDGLLAHRLGYAFIQYIPTGETVPLGPRLLHQGGRALIPILFAHGDQSAV
jgi:predicted HAD superfamily phosphohydrolase YqeG